MTDGRTAGQPLDELAAKAVQGDRAALDEFVRLIRDDVYGLAMRMLGHPIDAEDAAQEILIKVVTNLGGFRGDSSIRTWIRRIATNHLISVHRSRKEPEGLAFEAFEQMLAAGLAAGPSTPRTDVDENLLEEEVKLGCTQAMLMCLDREHRLAFLLGDVYELDSNEGAEALGITPAAFRKRLSRARSRMRAFMERNCGLVSESAPCRCRRQIGPNIRAGLIDPERLVYTIHPTLAKKDPVLWGFYQGIENVHKSTRVFRDHPDYAAPEALLDALLPD